jgi:hypothetical protein
MGPVLKVINKYIVILHYASQESIIIEIGDSDNETNIDINNKEKDNPKEKLETDNPLKPASYSLRKQIPLVSVFQICAAHYVCICYYYVFIKFIVIWKYWMPRSTLSQK